MIKHDIQQIKVHEKSIEYHLQQNIIENNGIVNKNIF